MKYTLFRAIKTYPTSQKQNYKYSCSMALILKMKWPIEIFLLCITLWNTDEECNEVSMDIRRFWWGGGQEGGGGGRRIEK